jgi:hypothetical protein
MYPDPVDCACAHGAIFFLKQSQSLSRMGDVSDLVSGIEEGVFSTVAETDKGRRYPMEQVVRSLPQAFRIIKEMSLYGGEGSDYRSLARDLLSKILEDRMRDRMDAHLAGMAYRDESDRRNGYFSRHFLTE